MRLRLLAVLAHPDDESLGFGGTLARYAAEGVETYLVTATRGERGRFGSLGKSGDPVEVGRVREAELREAAAVLGIREVSILNYPDGAVDEVPAAIAIRAIASHIRRIRPHVIVTFGPDGAYGHPDHIAVSQFTTAAAVCAADTAYRIVDGSQTDPAAPHRVEKLFHLAWRNSKWEAYRGRLSQADVDGRRRSTAGCSLARLGRDNRDRHVRLLAHRLESRLLPSDAVVHLRAAGGSHGGTADGTLGYTRVLSRLQPVNGGRKLETDLFEGLR